MKRAMTRMTGVTIGLALLLPLIVTGAYAADITVVAKQTPTTMEPAVIYIKGRFSRPDEYLEFRAVTGAISRAIVFFNSPGGFASVGVGIGETIRQKRFTTAVADNETCTSACALAWISGTLRMMGPHSHIGFHAPFNKDTLIELPSVTAATRTYLTWLGVSEVAARNLTLPLGPNNAVWLTLDNAKEKFDVFVMPLPRGADAHWYSLNPSKIPYMPIYKPPAIGPNEQDGVGGRA